MSKVKPSTWFNGYEYRSKVIAGMHKLPEYLRYIEREHIATLDTLAPGWKRARRTEIVGRIESNGYSPDLVYELPGRISVRGWEMTGVIDKLKK